MIEKIRKNIKLKLKNEKISLSGEINILAIDMKKAISLDDDLYSMLNDQKIIFEEKFPFLTFSTSRELHEINMKIVSVNSIFCDDNFLEIFADNISLFLNKIHNPNELKIRINIFGNIENWYEKKSFIMVNEIAKLHFKISDKIKNSFLSNKIGLFVDNYLLKDLFNK